jgi:catechol 1,2-dioxygenase
MGTGAVAAASLVSCGDDAAGVDGGASADSGAGTDSAPSPDANDLCRITTPDALGPFHEAGAPMRTMIAENDEPGERVMISGVVVADDCVTPISGALLDIWQADVDGNYHDAGVEYRLRGQVLTDDQGRYAFESIKPGNYLIGDNSWRPAHIHFLVSKPSYLPVTTQLYFAGDPYLPPNDGCTTCGSDDPDRIIELAGDANAGWAGEFQIVLARA